MNSREENKQLKRQIDLLKAQNKFLGNKVDQLIQELHKVAKDKGTLSTLRKKNSFLKDENEKLSKALSEYEHQGSRIIDIQARQMKNRISELEKSKVDLRVELLKKIDKIAELEYELKHIQPETFIMNMSQCGEIPKEYYDHVKFLEQQLQSTRSNYYGTLDRYNMLLKYLVDEEQNKHVQEYLDTYLRKRRGARKKISDEKIKTIKELREGGMSIRDIASIVGISVGSVHRYLK